MAAPHLQCTTRGACGGRTRVETYARQTLARQETHHIKCGQGSVGPWRFAACRAEPLKHFERRRAPE